MAQIGTQDTVLIPQTLLLPAQAMPVHIFWEFFHSRPKNINGSFVSRKLSQADREKEAESIACLAKLSLCELIEVRCTNAFWGIM